MKPSEWAKQEGIHYQTAWHWYHKGLLPVPATRTPSGAILVEVPRAGGNNMVISEIVTEVGSEMNGRRRKLAKLLSDAQVTTIVVEHRDRLARLGVEQIEAALHDIGPKALSEIPGELSHPGERISS